MLITLLLVGVSSGFTQKKDTIAIINAGSSGSRLYVYERVKNDKNRDTLILLFSTSKGKEGKALSSLKDSTEIGNFLNTITAEHNLKSQTVNLYVLATAGMRNIDKKKADTIYQIMGNRKINGYKIKQAMTISGRYEGLYAWIAVNYDKGLLLKEGTSTYGILEIGGASMQITFTLSENIADAIEREKRKIYSKSYIEGGVNKMYDATKNIQNTSDLKKQFCVKTWGEGIGTLKTLKKNIPFAGLGGTIQGVVTDSNFLKSISDDINEIRGEKGQHNKFNAFYLKWVLNELEINEIEPKAGKDKGWSDWTKGAAYDILINEKVPESFNYEQPN